MAELGDIQHTNVNQGTRVVDRSLETRALAQGLDVVKKTVDEGVKAKVTGDMLEAINETESNVPVYEPQDFVPGSREEYLSNKLDRLNAVIEQGKKSQQDWAQMQVKRVLAEAQAKYPWIADQLQSRAGSVMAGSERLQQLGLDDAARSAAAQAAQSEFDEIVDRARTPWENGGLGIPSHIDPRTPYFARLYDDLQGLRNAQQEGARRAGMAIAHAQIDVNNPRTYDELSAELRGKTSIIGAQYEGIKRRNGFYEHMENVALGDRADLEAVERFRTVNSREMREEVIVERFQLKELWRDMQTKIPNMTQTETGKKLEAEYKDALADYDLILASIDKLGEDTPTATQMIDRAMSIRQNDAFQDLPEAGKKQLAFFTGPVGGRMLELTALLKNPTGINMGNKVALAQQTYMSGLFPELFDQTNPQYDTFNQMTYFKSTGALEIPPGASAEEIQAKINRVQKNPNSTFVVPGRNDQELTILALQNKDLHLSLLTAAQDTLDMASPEFANAGLLGLTYSLSFLNDAPNAPNVKKDMLEGLSNGSLDNAINISLSGQDRGARQAFADEALQFYRSTKPEERKQEMANYYRNHRIGGVALSELVVVDPAAIDDNAFVWSVNSDLVTKAAEARVSIAPGLVPDVTGSKLKNEERKVERDINEAMARIQTEMDQQIRIEMTINKAKANDPNSMRMADEWASHFLGAGDPAGQTHAWANIFNYGEGSVTRSR